VIPGEFPDQEGPELDFGLAEETDAPRPDDRSRAAKSDAAFRTISEVATDLNVPQHVLRFWETKFSQVRPLKRGGGRRYYRPEDVALLKRIRGLLYTDGMTIRGVQKLLRETGTKAADEPLREAKAEAKPETPSMGAPAGPHLSRDEAKLLLAELTGLRDDLKKALAA
jgi:DNA-binding transcriptional MerR regulator